MVKGHHEIHETLESALAEFTGREAALVFSTGFMANTGVIDALVSRKDSVIQDKLNHASLIDGGLVSGAKFLRYGHNDLDQLENHLKKAPGKKLVVTDGVFSMDGDCAHLTEMSALCEKYNAFLMVDDAHGFGTLGPKGAGLIGEQGLSQKQVPAVIGTFGKAFGTSGAFVAGSHEFIQYLIQKARSYIYTTAAPPAIAAATLTSLKLVQHADVLRQKLKHNIEKLRAGLTGFGYELMPSHTAIQPVLVGENDRAMQMSEALRSRGLLITAIRPPTVPVGSARLRITLSAEHTDDDIDRLLAVMKGFA